MRPLRLAYSLSLFLLFCLVACVATDVDRAQVAFERPRPTATAALPTRPPQRTGTADESALEPLAAALVAAGATVVNHGRTDQGLFPAEDIGLWHLIINDARIQVYEFADTVAREAVSSHIAPTGDAYTVADGDTTVTTTWDGEGPARWWVQDHLLVGYWGENKDIANLLTTVLGPAVADGTRPYRPEAYSGAVAGIGDYGVHFQYDPHLAAGIQSRLVDAYATDSGMDYLLLPQHLSFIFADSYAEGKPLLQRWQLNIETMPQIVVVPAVAYAAMQPLAGRQVEQLRALLAARPAVPGGTMPYLPLVNAAQVFHGQVAYLTFAHGAGVRYVTAFSQDASPVTNGQLLYTFQGLTDDGQYYVAAFFPVTTAVLPDTIEVADWDAFSVNYSTYVRETKAALDGLGPLDFDPDFSLLDAVVSSLRVEPDVALTGVETGILPYQPARIGPMGVYQVYDSSAGLYRLVRVDADGSPRQVSEQRDAMLPAPDAAHAVYMDGDGRLWLIDLATGRERRLAEGRDLAGMVVWGDDHTLLLGVLLSAAEGEGPSTGHLATLDIDGGELQIIEPAQLSAGRPAPAPDGQAIAYDIAAGAGDEISSRIYRPGSGSQLLDPALFAGLEGEQGRLFNPAWSPDGQQLAWLWGVEDGARLVVLDLVRHTAMTLFGWQPAQFGALPPSPVWSPDGKWVAIEVWANNSDETGLWILPADGTQARLHVPTGGQPLWLNATQLIYADLDENMNGDVKLFDLDFGELGVLDLPPASTMLLPSPSSESE